MKFGAVKITQAYIPTRFVWIVIFLDEPFKYDDVAKFWGYDGKNAEPLCVVYGFLQFLTFVNYLTYCYIIQGNRRIIYILNFCSFLSMWILK
jgi:hypothetical protein